MSAYIRTATWRLLSSAVSLQAPSQYRYYAVSSSQQLSTVGSAFTQRTLTSHGPLRSTTLHLPFLRTFSTADNTVPDYTAGFSDFKLKSSWSISEDSKVLRFELPDEVSLHARPHAPAGVKIRATLDGEFHDKSYSPISLPAARGHFDLLVKGYQGGGLGQHLCGLAPGDTVHLWAKPRARFEYAPNQFEAVGLVANGTGVAPFVQIIRMAMEDPNDRTHISLVFANRRESDILLKEELDMLAGAHSRMSVFHTLSQPAPGWEGGKGHVDLDMLRTHLPPPGEATKLLVCGTDGFVERVAGPRKEMDVGGMLADMGYTSQMVRKL